MPRIKKNIDEQNSIPYSPFERSIHSADFLKDQDLFRDPLPQPYRRIDKILQELIDDVCFLCEKKDIEKEIELRKPRAVTYSVGSKVHDLGQFNCVRSSTDEYNEYLFVGSNGSIACIDASGNEVIDRIDLNQFSSSDNTKIVLISSAKIKQSLHLVSAISSSGYLFMNLFFINKFFPVPQLIDGDGERKFLYRKCEISKNCDYMALFIESKVNTSDCFVEIYKCPKDTWLQAVELNETSSIANIKKLNSARLNSSSLKLNAINETQLSGGGGSNNNFETSSSELVTGLSAQAAEQATLEHTTGKHEQLSLSKPSLVCKLKPPQNQFKFNATNAANFAQLLKTVEANGTDTIGQGINNCLTKTYLDVKNQLSEKIFDARFNDDQLAQISGTKNFDLHGGKINADFKFLPSNRIINQPNLEPLNEIPCSVVICWNNCNQLVFYPLSKINKENESKIEYTLPFSSQIANFKLTKCNTLISVLLKNNNLIVFDLNTGVERCCVNVDVSESIRDVHFLPLRIPDKTVYLTSKLATLLRIESKLVYLTSAGRVYVVDASLASDSNPQCVFTPQLANKDDKIVFIMPIKNLPTLILAIGETAKVFLLNLETEQLVCELDYKTSELRLPNEHYECAYSAKGFQLFLKYESSNVGGESSLMCHSLSLVPILDDYLSTNYNLLNNCMPINALLAERANNLLRIRIEEHSLRKERLNNIWNNLDQLRNY